MLLELLIGSMIVSATVIIHAVTQERTIFFLEWAAPILGKFLGKHWKIITVIMAVMGMLIALIIEMWLWAMCYLWVNEPSLTTLEAALYFSASTFTTLGYGDIVLSPEWRLLGSFEATNGLLLFGWTTAFLLEVITDVYRSERISGDMARQNSK